MGIKNLLKLTGKNLVSPIPQSLGVTAISDVMLVYATACKLLHLRQKHAHARTSSALIATIISAAATTSIATTTAATVATAAAADTYAAAAQAPIVCGWAVGSIRWPRPLLLQLVCWEGRCRKRWHQRRPAEQITQLDDHSRGLWRLARYRAGGQREPPMCPRWVLLLWAPPIRVSNVCVRTGERFERRRRWEHDL